MPVRQLLRTHTSRDIAEWRAYAALYGLADPWVTDALADIHEQLQYIAHVQGGMLADEDDGNPVGPPVRYPRQSEQRPAFHFEAIADEEDDEEEG